MFGHTKYPNPKERLIYKRQHHEQTASIAKSNVKDYLQLKQNVDHWKKDSQKFEHNKRMKSHLEKEEKKKKDLESRKKKLKQVLVNDRQQYRAIMKGNVITMEDRIRAIEKESLALEQNNINGKQKYVKRVLQEKLQQEDDDLRQERSRLFLQYCDSKKQDMTKQNKIEQALKQREHQLSVNQWINDANNKNDSESANVEKRKLESQNHFEGINKQIEYKENQKKLELEEKIREMEIMKENNRKYLEEKENTKIRRQNHDFSIPEAKPVEERKQRRRRRPTSTTEAPHIPPIPIEPANNNQKRRDAFERDQKKYIEYNKKLTNLIKGKQIMLEEKQRVDSELQWQRRNETWTKEADAKEMLLQQVELDRLFQRQQKSIQRNQEAMKSKESCMNTINLDRNSRAKRDYSDYIPEKPSFEPQQRNTYNLDDTNKKIKYDKEIEEQKEILAELCAQDCDKFFNKSKQRANWFTS